MASTLALLSILFSIFFMLFTLIEATHNTTEKTQPIIIPLGSFLAPKGENTSWQSSSGHFAFGFYPKGNGFAVGIWLVNPSENTTTVVWTANRDAPAVSSKSMLNLTEQGLLLQNGNRDSAMNKDLRDDSEENLVSKASMHDSGNFVLYDENSTVIWQSFDHPTDTILGGQSLTAADDYLISSVSESDHSSGRFYLGVQGDRSVAAYPFYSFRSDEDAYWDSNTSHQMYGQQLSLDIKGFLCVNAAICDPLNRVYPYSSCTPESPDHHSQCFNHTNKPRKKSNNATSIYRATLDVDGNLRLYEHQFHFEGNNSSRVVMLWKALNETCLVKGFCGLNSYCTSNISSDAVCKCYPGFILSETKSNPKLPMDCVQKHSKDDCESSEGTALYNYTNFKNMSWGDIPYSVIPVMNMKTCEQACQEDCVCGGAIYTNTSCNKYRLPLIYGRVQNDSSTVSVALLKIRSSTTAIISPPTSNNTNVPKPEVVVESKRNLIMILSLTLGVVALICLVFAVSVFFTYRRQVNRYAMLSESEKLEFTEECSLRSFSFDELEKSTGGFSEEIGRGSFGVVYKGKRGNNNKSIAVKRLEERITDEGEREFQAEITAIARTHHRNLVKLVGFCIEGSKKLLVYEFVSKGSLANLLFEGETRLSWKDKMKLALDVARGLLYLHEECDVRIIHCNINPRKILIDEAWTAKITDFGFARLSKRGHSRTKIGDGTSRYLAPEWQKEDASVSVKADVYSFGVVLLEIICRKRSIDMNNISSADEIPLSTWVYQCFASGQLNKLITHNENDMDWKILERMVKVGLWCVQDHQSLRPAMKNVILMLEGLKDIPVPPSAARLLE
ncbi:G-type lectin S-receptor-like serine/threonine-protein kinase LECRK1 [Medicago truncatula]|uniref:Receptor-like serine/threonine-protein kinase n=1 Tax=Medicago truncatula TaxID=3880 RepID=G7JCZ7_MEDTR|nr:G-type lectin S-receptor-like serine/threonine-protein kinase LECRK1 [Medicago truncatula]AES91506.1 lectin kinase family protein [Medicago truncatula]